MPVDALYVLSRRKQGFESPKERQREPGQTPRPKHARKRRRHGVPVVRPVADHARAGPTRSAMVAPRLPIGFSGPVVVSFAVWCSISELSSAPTRMIHMEM